MTLQPLGWRDNRLRILDQTKLPQQEVYLDLADYREIVEAIKQLKVRGAPAIGIAAAYGILVGALNINASGSRDFTRRLEDVISDFASSRPTAVNLFYAIGRMREAMEGKDSINSILAALADEADSIYQSEEMAMSDLSKAGAELFEDGDTVLTHCNTGQLATGVSYGTALGVIKAAVEQGKHISVYADETRPLLQGARLTVWELQRLNIPVTLITDNMAGHFLHRQKIDRVVVGADRIAANGDTANKIGTYSVSVLSHANKVPFYIAAPTSTIDTTIKTGKDIPIEERSASEVLQIQGVSTAPSGTSVANPAFDVTPHKYISAIITENGIIRMPYRKNISTTLQEDI